MNAGQSHRTGEAPGTNAAENFSPAIPAVVAPVVAPTIVPVIPWAIGFLPLHCIGKCGGKSSPCQNREPAQ